ncbi:MAG: response regulator [Bdellovibrionales bacterium]|nr:response regulator [Bdellovibrionales bacterium]NQZ17709.1 response regulator [Bdellovibrionales bacterium]
MVRSSNSSKIPTNKKTALIVDDNIMDCSILEYYLGQSEHETVTCTNGFEALELIFAKNFDLILIDVCMPQINGLQLQKRVNKYCKMKNIPIVLMSADQTDARTILSGMKNGAKDFLVKPIAFQTLTKKIEKLYFNETHLEESEAHSHEKDI